MRHAIGIDLVEDERLAKTDRGFLERVFHPNELATKKLATIFALKEATFKALKRRPAWLEIEVAYEEDIPRIILSSAIRPEGLISLDSSVSHEKGLTTAIVILDLRE